MESFCEMQWTLPLVKSSITATSRIALHCDVNYCNAKLSFHKTNSLLFDLAKLETRDITILRFAT